MRNKYLVLVLILIGTFIFSACNNQESVKPSELEYLDSEIEINGLSEDKEIIKVRDLIELECVSEKVVSQRNNGDKVKIKAVGPTLETFLEQYGKKQTDFTSVRFYATDGYSIAVSREMLENREVILAFMDGKRAFPKTELPLRIVIPGERAMYWAKMVNRIDFEHDGMALYTEKIVFLDSALPALEGEYNEEEGGDIVSTVDLLDEFGGVGEKVIMYASDDLTKNETADNFALGYLKYTGENIPQFCSPELPEGMNLNGIVSIRTGRVMYYSLEEAEGILPERESEGKKGLGITDIARGNSFATAASYELTGRNLEKISVLESELVKGVFYKDGESWSFYLNDDKQINDIMILEALK